MTRPRGSHCLIKESLKHGALNSYRSVSQEKGEQMRQKGAKRFMAFLLAAAMTFACVPAAAETTEGKSVSTETIPVQDDEIIDVSDSVYQFGGYPDLGEMELAGAAIDPVAEAAVEAEILNGIRNRQRYIYVGDNLLPRSSYYGIYCNLLNKHPELYYIDAWFSITSVTINDEKYVQYFWPRYSIRYPEGTEEEFEERIQWFISGVRPEWSDVEKALYLHDLLCFSMEYDHSKIRHNAYNAIVEGSSVCIGYAMAYKLLCNRVGVTCEVVESSEIEHAWNRVIIDGESFYVDCTWDDDGGHYVSHQYFLCSRDSFGHNHHLQTGAFADNWGDMLESELYYNVPGSTRYDSIWWKTYDYRNPIRPIQINGGTKWLACASFTGQVLKIYGWNIDGSGLLKLYERPNVGSVRPVMDPISDTSLLVSVSDMIIEVDSDGQDRIVYQLPDLEAYDHDIYGVRTEDEYAVIEVRVNGVKSYRKVRISDGQEVTYTPTPTIAPWAENVGTPTPTIDPSLPTNTPTPTPDGYVPTETPTPTDTPVPTATNTPTPTQGASNYQTWDPQTVYLGGDTVVYQGGIYRAKWWTMGDAPSANGSGPWEYLGEEQGSTPTATPTATSTPVPTATNTPVPTATNTPVPTATNTPVPTATNAPTATSTPVPTATNAPTATSTPVPTATNTPVPTATNTPTPTTGADPVYPAWTNDGTLYQVGDRVVYQGKIYECTWMIFGYDGYDPVSLPAFWTYIGEAGGQPGSVNGDVPEASGTFSGNGWLRNDSSWYFFEDGIAREGWVKSAGKWYFLDKSTGAMKTGWFKSSGKWYYADKNGAMQANKWVMSGGKWYYLGSDGAMVAGKTVTIKGVLYSFDKNGEWKN